MAEAVRREQLIAIESPAERALRYPAFAASAARGSHAAWMALPLVAGGRIVGALGLSFGHERHFTDGDRAFALALSRQAGQALERSRLLATEHEARARAEKMAGDLAQLHALTTSLGRAEGAVGILRVIEAQLEQGVGAVRSGVYLVGEDGSSLSLVRDAGTVGDADDPLLPLLERRSPVADALSLAQSLWLTDDRDWAAYPELDAARPPGMGAVGVVPLIVEERMVGVLVVV